MIYRCRFCGLSIPIRVLPVRHLCPGRGQVVWNGEDQQTDTRVPSAAAIDRVNAYHLQFTIRNLLYHVHPTDRKNDLIHAAAWRANIRQIAKRLHLFNGRIVVGVMTGPDLEPLSVVRDEFEIYGFDSNKIEFICLPNAPLASECTTFRTLLPLLKSSRNNEVTFFAHTKGSWNPNISIRRGIMYWRNALYHRLLDDFDKVDQVLQTHACVGGCKIVPGDGGQRFPSGLNYGSWHFSGTFFWFRHDRLYTHPKWSYVPYDRYGTEAYLGGIFRPEDGVSLYQPDVPEKDGKYYDITAHPDRIEDEPDPVLPTIHIGTAITNDFTSHARLYLSSLQRMRHNNKFCVCFGFYPADQLREVYSSIRFAYLDRTCVESFGMIQHGPWLDACHWINDDDICILTDADVLIQRAISYHEAARFAGYSDTTIGIGDNAGPDDSLDDEAKRIRFTDPDKRFGGDWSQIPIRNCGVIVAKAKLIRKLRAVYDAESKYFHTFCNDRARIQWLISYLVYREGWTLDRLSTEIHANGHFRMPAGCTYDGDGNLLYNGRLVLFRHVL